MDQKTSVGLIKQSSSFRCLHTFCRESDEFMHQTCRYHLRLQVTKATTCRSEGEHGKLVEGSSAAALRSTNICCSLCFGTPFRPPLDRFVLDDVRLTLLWTPETRVLLTFSLPAALPLEFSEKFDVIVVLVCVSVKKTIMVLGWNRKSCDCECFLWSLLPSAVYCETMIASPPCSGRKVNVWMFVTFFLQNQSLLLHILNRIPASVDAAEDEMIFPPEETLTTHPPDTQSCKSENKEGFALRMIRL